MHTCDAIKSTTASAGTGAGCLPFTAAVAASAAVVLGRVIQRRLLVLRGVRWAVGEGRLVLDGVGVMLG